MNNRLKTRHCVTYESNVTLVPGGWKYYTFFYALHIAFFMFIYKNY